MQAGNYIVFILYLHYITSLSKQFIGHQAEYENGGFQGELRP